MINNLKQKILSLQRIFGFFDKWYEIFSLYFLLYILLVFFATILESISIISLIPLVQSLQTFSPENNEELSFFNEYLMNLKEKFNFGIVELLILFFSLQTIKLIVTHLADILLFKKTFDINQKFQKNIIENVLSMSWVECLKVSTGKINNLVSQDSPRAAGVFKILCNGLNYSIFICIYLVGLLYISIDATIIVAVFGLISFTVLKIVSKTTYISGDTISKSSKDYLDRITDFILQMKSLKTSNYISFVNSKIDRAFFNYRDSQILQQYMRVSLSFFQNLTLIILFGFIILFFLQKGKIYIADSFIFIFVSYRLSQQMMVFQASINSAVAYIPSINKIENFFLLTKKKNELSKFGSIKLNLEKIKFENIECKLNKNLIFKNLNFEIKKNSFIAITGRSGIGKSTLVDMISGLIMPTNGKIIVNGINFNTIDINHWRSNIAYVPQEHFLLKDSIKNNIILNQKFQKKKFDELINLLELKELDSDLVVSEKGGNLSVGQKQRISIARALYSDRKIVILDEPTSSLNTLLEKKILSYFKNKEISKTIIMITHNISATKYASEVYKIKKNGIIKI